VIAEAVKLKPKSHNQQPTTKARNKNKTSGSCHWCADMVSNVLEPKSNSPKNSTGSGRGDGHAKKGVAKSGIEPRNNTKKQAAASRKIKKFQK
jgi:hypothetical protein